MKVLILDTGRGISNEKVQMWRAALGLDEADQVSLVGWFPTRHTLSVTRHLVCGPELRLGRPPVDAEVLSPWVAAPMVGSAPSRSASDVSDAQTQDLDAANPLGTLELDEQLTEQEAGRAQAAAADLEPAALPLASPPDAAARPGESPDATSAADVDVATPAPSPRPTDLSQLSVYHPRRIRQALLWRRKRAQRRARRLISRQVRRARTLRAELGSLPGEVLRSSLDRHKDAISWQFALATTRSEAVNDLVRTAHVVVPVDVRSQKAAWLLARRHPGPDVVVTLPTAARAVERRRVRG